MDSLPASSAGTYSSRSDTIFSDSSRPSGSSILWAHLLRKNDLQSSSASQLPLPPIAPIDKSATSTRILLLDTQAHLEKFARSVEVLTVKVDNAKQEIATVKTLFDQDREVLMGDLGDKLNRIQAEIQKGFGNPAQASKLDDIRTYVELKLENMDQRLDSMQMLSQSYSQMLQNQSQVLQSLQDQQGIIIGALTPLLPLLQAVPMHIESARTNVTESLSKYMQSLQLTSFPTHRNVPFTPGRKRSLSITSSTGRKKRRVDENGDTSGLSKAAGTTPNLSRTLLGSATRTHVSVAPRLPLAELPLAKYGTVTSSSPYAAKQSMDIAKLSLSYVTDNQIPQSKVQILPSHTPGNSRRGSPALTSNAGRSPTDSLLSHQPPSVPQTESIRPSIIAQPKMPNILSKTTSSVPKFKQPLPPIANSNTLSRATPTPTPTRRGPTSMRIQGANINANVSPHPFQQLPNLNQPTPKSSPSSTLSAANPGLHALV
ncbi:hypothetical protein D9757_010329 [Collybiopsis confluens]|uniref:Uncharacterized protein n=1 Tax=Collybiopsis confluens TaxID=2823264 RepID=A0A8H5LSD6_9AGAR|nr:hypothetical protein D9757_010329 [Collybiopsis confluens]